jgi:hypothetical protein
MFDECRDPKYATVNFPPLLAAECACLTDAVFVVLQKHIEALPTCVRDLWTDERGVTFSHLTVDLPDLLALFGEEHASDYDGWMVSQGIDPGGQEHAPGEDA